MAWTLNTMAGVLIGEGGLGERQAMCDSRDRGGREAARVHGTAGAIKSWTLPRSLGGITALHEALDFGLPASRAGAE